MSWFDDAACKGMDPNAFHPRKGEPLEKMRAVCAECPVRQECLEFALADASCKGLWGGLSERQRATIRRQRFGSRRGQQPQPIKHGTAGGYLAHRRRGEAACDTCKAAHSVKRNARKAAQREVAA